MSGTAVFAGWLRVRSVASPVGWPDQKTMDLIQAHDVEAAEKLRPAITFYIAFSREPKALSDFPSIAEVVSTSGWQGETLGETVTAGRLTNTIRRHVRFQKVRWP